MPAAPVAPPLFTPLDDLDRAVDCSICVLRRLPRFFEGFVREQPVGALPQVRVLQGS